MGDHEKVYVVCENKCLEESMTREQIESGIEDASTGIVDETTGIKYKHIHLTRAEYDALGGVYAPNTYYYVIDDELSERGVEVTLVKNGNNYSLEYITPNTLQEGMYHVMLQCSGTLSTPIPGRDDPIVISFCEFFDLGVIAFTRKYDTLTLASRCVSSTNWRAVKALGTESAYLDFEGTMVCRREITDTEDMRIIKISFSSTRDLFDENDTFKLHLIKIA